MKRTIAMTRPITQQAAPVKKNASPPTPLQTGFNHHHNQINRYPFPRRSIINTSTSGTSATVNHLDSNKIVLLGGDNYLQSLRFYIITLFGSFGVFLVLFSYASILHIDATTLSLSPDALAMVILGIGFLLAFISSAFRITRVVPIEYAIFAAAIWFAYSAVTQDSCLCCTPGIMHDEHSGRGTPSLLDSMNHGLVGTQATCSNPWAVFSIHNSIVLFILFLCYIDIGLSRDYFRIFARAREDAADNKRRIRMQQRELVDKGIVGSELANAWTWERSRLSTWLRVTLLVLIIIAMAIPLAENSPLYISLNALLGRILLAVCVLLLRLCNSYYVRYNQLKTAQNHTALCNNAAISSRHLDLRFGECNNAPISSHIIIPKEDNTDFPRLQYSSSLEDRYERNRRSEEAAEESIAINDTEVLERLQIQQHTQWGFVCIYNVAVASIAYILCGWFLIAVAIQVIAELFHLQLSIDYHARLIKTMALLYDNKTMKQEIRTPNSRQLPSDSSLIGQGNRILTRPKSLVGLVEPRTFTVQ